VSKILCDNRQRRSSHHKQAGVGMPKDMESGDLDPRLLDGFSHWPNLMRFCPGAPSLESITLLPSLPAASCRKKNCPSPVKTTWRALPDFDFSTKNVSESGLKSQTRSAHNSP
jgi:hypothetical protein